MRLIRLFKKDLASECSHWVEQNLISEDQARAICQTYDIDYDASHSKASGYKVLISLGYLFIGLALITLLGANWDEIPRALRMGSLLLLTVGTHGIAFRFHLAGKRKNASGLFFLGNLFYGASIILIAQIYHLGEHMPDGVFWWALGTLPFGVLLKDSMLTLFSCLLALVWFWLEYSLGFFASLFPVFFLAGLYVLFKGPQSTLLFMTVIGSICMWFEVLLSVAWSDSRNRLDLHAEHFFVSVALFIFAYTVSHWLNARNSSKARDYAALLALWSLRFGLIVMLILSFAEPWRELIRADFAYQTLMWQLVLLLLAAAAWLGWKCRQLRLLVSLITFSGLSMLMAAMTDNTDHAVTFQIVYNIALVACGIWLIVRGINSGISHYFFLGITAILLTALMRYIDLIGEYVGGAILFMVLAAFLLSAAKYWKQHQESLTGVTEA